MEKQRTPSVIGMLFTVIGVVGALLYLLIALNTQDSLWFVSSYDEYPYEMAIYCYGEEIVLVPEHPDFNDLVDLVNTTLSEPKNWDGLTMSVDTYEEYTVSPVMMVLELFYTPPIRVHSVYRYFSDLNSIVIPLDGRHANTNAIFGLIGTNPGAGSLHYAGIPDIRAFIEARELCTAP
jgi:hypothetical protein